MRKPRMTNKPRRESKTKLDDLAARLDRLETMLGEAAKA